MVSMHALEEQSKKKKKKKKKWCLKKVYITIEKKHVTSKPV